MWRQFEASFNENMLINEDFFDIMMSEHWNTLFLIVNILYFGGNILCVEKEKDV